MTLVDILLNKPKLPERFSQATEYVLNNSKVPCNVDYETNSKYMTIEFTGTEFEKSPSLFTYEHKISLETFFDEVIYLENNKAKISFENKNLEQKYVEYKSEKLGFDK